MMVQLPYLQPFDDVNKRVSRLASNIPLIKANLTPLSFTDVPTMTYTEAVLGVYELNEIDLLKDVFIWAYERSAARYAAVRQSLGEPDPFRLKHRAILRETVREIVLEELDKKSAFARIANWAAKNVEADEREQFREVAENELLRLHEGNFVRYQIRPSEFQAWQKIWTDEASRNVAAPIKKRLKNTSMGRANYERSHPCCICGIGPCLTSAPMGSEQTRGSAANDRVVAV